MNYPKTIDAAEAALDTDPQLVLDVARDGGASLSAALFASDPGEAAHFGNPAALAMHLAGLASANRVAAERAIAARGTESAPSPTGSSGAVAEPAALLDENRKLRAQLDALEPRRADRAERLEQQDRTAAARPAPIAAEPPQRMADAEIVRVLGFNPARTDLRSALERVGVYPYRNEGVRAYWPFGLEKRVGRGPAQRIVAELNARLEAEAAEAAAT